MKNSTRPAWPPYDVSIPATTLGLSEEVPEHRFFVSRPDDEEGALHRLVVYEALPEDEGRIAVLSYVKFSETDGEGDSHEEGSTSFVMYESWKPDQVVTILDHLYGAEALSADEVAELAICIEEELMVREEVLYYARIRAGGLWEKARGYGEGEGDLGEWGEWPAQSQGEGEEP